MVKINYFFTTFLLLGVIVAYLIYSYVRQTLHACGVEGSYVRIDGDHNQAKYVDNVFNGFNNKFIYYDENKNVINEGKSIQSLLGGKRVADHPGSYSKCTTSYSAAGSFNRCDGVAEKKHNKTNVKYTSYHKYFTVDNQVYYENIYFFNDGTTSYALYKKMD